MKLRTFLLLALLPLIAAAQSPEPARADEAPRPTEATPTEIPGAETFIYHDVKPEPMRLHVFKPNNWNATDKRPALVHFFGGGWRRGTPLQATSWAKQAAKLGLVGIAADYRVLTRHGTDATASISDARAAVRWLQDHAATLGIDPQRIVASGSSAGGHLALWTAIAKSPPGSDPQEAPLAKPVALILLWPAADLTFFSTQQDRFGGHGLACSPAQHLDAKMPPSLLLHGDKDPTVPFESSVALHRTLTQGGNFCEFIPMPGNGHGTTLPEWKQKVPGLIENFLREQKLIRTTP